LVRDLKAVVDIKQDAKPDAKPDALSLEEIFIDIFMNSSGMQGLGILPDILGVNDKANEAFAASYQQIWQGFEKIQKSLITDYRLRSALESNIASHPLREYLGDAKLPLVSGQQSPGIAPALQSFLKGQAKINLWLGTTNADIELVNLSLAQSLSDIPDMRVLIIECGQYPGKAAADCVRAALTKLKINDLDSVRQKPKCLHLQVKMHKRLLLQFHIKLKILEANLRFQ
jgi:hypothetical protein